MPFVGIYLDDAVTSHQANEVRDRLVGLLAELTGKSPKWFMTATIIGDVKMNGKPAAYIDFRYLGELNREAKERIADMIGSLIEAETGIPEDQVYITFRQFESSDWAWSGKLFG